MSRGWKSSIRGGLAGLLALAVLWTPAAAAAGDGSLAAPAAVAEQAELPTESALDEAEQVAAATAVAAASEQRLFDLVNADRERAGLQPLVFDPSLLVIARQRASAQLGPGPLSHYDESGQLIFGRLLQQDRIAYTRAAENLARSVIADPRVEQHVEEALLASELHRKNIMGESYTSLAIGAATDGAGNIAYAQIFIASR